MATSPESLPRRLARQLQIVAIGAVMAAIAAFVAYHGLMAAMRMVVGAP